MPTTFMMVTLFIFATFLRREISFRRKKFKRNRKFKNQSREKVSVVRCEKCFSLKRNQLNCQTTAHSLSSGNTENGERQTDRQREIIRVKRKKENFNIIKRNDEKRNWRNELLKVKKTRITERTK